MSMLAGSYVNTNNTYANTHTYAIVDGYAHVNTFVNSDANTQ